MNELTFQCGTSDDFTVTILEGDEEETHQVEIPVESIKLECDWSILQVENFEVRIQFQLSSPVPPDFIDRALDLISGPKSWYFRADELYALLKTVSQQLQLPSQLGVTSEQVVERVSKLVDMATEAVMKRFSLLSPEDEISVLKKVDEVLTTQCTVFDSMVDSSRIRLVDSLRKLKGSLEARLKEHKLQAMQYVETTVETTKDATNKAMENIQSSVESIQVNAKSSVDEAKGHVDNYKAYVHEKVESVTGKVQEQITSVKDEVTVKMNTLSEESKKWATEFLAARVVQGKEALDRAQPYVIQATGATQPYASRVATAAGPYIEMAKPYVEEAKKKAEENQYVGPYVEPVLNTATQIIDGAKTYMGLSEQATASTGPSNETTDN